MLLINWVKHFFSQLINIGKTNRLSTSYSLGQALLVKKLIFSLLVPVAVAQACCKAGTYSASVVIQHSGAHDSQEVEDGMPMERNGWGADLSSPCQDMPV